MYVRGCENIVSVPVASLFVNPTNIDKIEAQLIISKCQKESKTYNSRYSLVVTHLTTNRPVRSLSTRERTGSSVFCDLWSYVLVQV